MSPSDLLHYIRLLRLRQNLGFYKLLEVLFRLQHFGDQGHRGDKSVPPTWCLESSGTTT